MLISRNGRVFLTDSRYVEAAQKKTLAGKYYFEEMGREKEGTVVRFCTSWATKQEEVDALVLDISKLV